MAVSAFVHVTGSGGSLAGARVVGAVAHGVFLPELAVAVGVAGVGLAEVIALEADAVIRARVLRFAVARLAAAEATRTGIPVFAVGPLAGAALAAHVVSKLAW